MKTYQISLLLVAVIATLQCDDRHYSLTPTNKAVEILDIEKIDPNLLTVTVKNCCQSRKFVIVEIWAIRNDNTCGLALFSFEERAGIEPDDIQSQTRPISGVCNHQSYDDLQVNLTVNDHPFR
jgi:hypothetical protein